MVNDWERYIGEENMEKLMEDWLQQFGLGKGATPVLLSDSGNFNITPDEDEDIEIIIRKGNDLYINFKISTEYLYEILYDLVIFAMEIGEVLEEISDGHTEEDEIDETMIGNVPDELEQRVDEFLDTVHVIGENDE